MTKTVYILLILCIGKLSCQNVTIEGKITNSNKVSLSFASIIADPKENISIQFAISDDIGYYKLYLEKDKFYTITASYLGYKPIAFEISASNNITKDFILEESTETLGEVNLTYTPPIIIKKDTITYRTDAFTTGEERKLRDILKKLPAVEVDRAGNVTVQGKKITKVLVENKEFFTGDSKLAVNNIPADAVDKIEILDNYNEVGFLKGLEDSNDMAMNIKLKSEKKKFVFGDVDVGSGVKKRYLIHPALYYYSPKTSINAIGDFNNTGTKSFTVKDYLEFEGGTNRLINDTKSYFSLLNDEFSQFIGNQDFTSSRNQFNALNISQNIKQTTDLSTYGIWSNMKNENRIETLNDYMASNNLVENRTNSGNQKNEFGIGKFKLKLKPNNDTDITFDSYIKASQNFSIEKISTNTSENINIINNTTNAENISFKQDIQWHKQFNKNHTTSMVINYNYQKATPKTNWLTDNSILQNLLPLIDENTYNIFKTKRSLSNTIDFAVKHYMVLNNFNHIYLTLGTQITFDDLDTEEFQLLQDRSINDFSNFGFGNNVSLNFNDMSFGLHYKFQKGKTTFKPGLFYHHYNWCTTQFNERITNTKLLLLPELSADVEFSSTKKITFKYNLKARFPNLSQLANRLTLLNFNSLYKGNEQLENELYHHTQLRYSRFSLYKDIFYNFSASYRVKEDNFKNTTTIQGIDFLSTPILSNFEDKVWYFSGSIKKGLGKYKFSVNGNISLADYEKPINSIILANSSNNYNLGTGFETRFKTLPNLELTYNKSISNYSAITNSTFETNIFSALIEYNFLKDFLFKIDYNYEYYLNKTSKSTNTFNIVNSTFFYQKENKSLGFEITANNLFNVAFKQRNSFSSIVVTDEKTFILPRIIMLKITYKI